MNPEAVVVDRNLARDEQRGTLDTEYLWALSDDAVPAMAAMLPSLDAGTRDAVVRRIPGGPPAPGGLAANRSARTAADVRAEVCA